MPEFNLLNNMKFKFHLLIFSAGIGLLYVNASVWQMLRGSIIIFTGVLSVSKVISFQDMKFIHKHEKMVARTDEFIRTDEFYV